MVFCVGFERRFFCAPIHPRPQWFIFNSFLFMFNKVNVEKGPHKTMLSSEFFMCAVTLDKVLTPFLKGRLRGKTTVFSWWLSFKIFLSWNLTARMVFRRKAQHKKGFTRFSVLYLYALNVRPMLMGYVGATSTPKSKTSSMAFSMF